MNMTDAELAAINERARALAGELLDLLDIGDRQMAYLSASQVLLARAAIEPQQVLDALTTLVAHNLCGDAPIRLAILPVEARDEPQPAIH